MTANKNIVSYRESDGAIVKFECVEVQRDTAILAKEYAEAGFPDRYVVFTDKRIVNDDGEIESGLYMSLILRPSLFPSQASLLGAMSAVATISALDEHTSRRLGLGWVSEIYCEGTRIGRVSVEGKLDNHTTYEYIIVSFAIKLSEREFPPRLTDMIKKVFESDNTSISMIIAKNVLSKFFKLYVNLKISSKFMDTYVQRFILHGVRIRYTDGERKRTCKILGVDNKSGALILEGRHDEIIRVHSSRAVQMPKKVRLKGKDKA